MDDKLSIHAMDESEVADQTAMKGELRQNEFEIFRKEEGAVDFRTVHWLHASMIFLKIIFATGVLSIPSAMYSLGAFPGAINIIAWTAFNAYSAIIQGNFRNSHAKCHSIADMAQLVGGRPLREIVGALFLVTYIICGASGLLGISVALNAVSSHAICTQWFSMVATILVAMFASVRKFEKIAWLTWVGFISVFTAVLIVVISVTTRDRPAAAPQTGEFELGYVAVGDPTFVEGMVAAATIFASSAATSAFLPVIAEMRSPKDYPKAVYLCMSVVTSSYLCFSLVVYKWCGKWIASPSLGSAGLLIKKVSYGVALIGLAVSACLYIHVGSKYLFVRVLQNSPHFQKNSFVHWATWISITTGLSIISFLVASGIPVFNYIIALVGTVCFAPLGIVLPTYLWLFDHHHWWRGDLWKRLGYVVNILLMLIGVFMATGGTYAIVQLIIDAYATGTISSAFSCADNSGTVA